ncbi:MAG: hypothetical protein LC772_05995, partial [Chloroflexi bacterium]|nr:hypothetical protein [Chloroflexota bacterium]
QRAEWERFVDESLGAYQESLEAWESIAAQNPDAARIPRRLLDDTSDRASRQVERMRRNYGFDRARTFLPASVSTNLMLIMSARAWVQVCQHLLSHPLPEAQLLGQSLREELSLVAPRMLRHATETTSMVSGIRREFESLCAEARAHPPACLADRLPAGGPADIRTAERGAIASGLTDTGLIDAGTIGAECPSMPTLEVFPPAGTDPVTLASDLQFHDNRYAWMGSDIRRTLVRFRWEAITFAEIRDLNRHRTGTRFCPLRPQGFYAAQDELPATTAVETRHRFTELAHRGKSASARANEMLCAGEPGYVYWTLLGTQYPFEHSTTADKFLYEAELRTGAGAHYRYAKHLRDMLELWYRQFPETRGLVLEGSAEPE